MKELLDYLTDRPCTVCKFHEEKGCTKWGCVFDQREQEPKIDVLNKIRSEMQFYSNSFVLVGRNDLASAVSYCIEIIDKYKEG